MVTIYPMSTYTQMETNKIMKRFMSLFVIANIILLQLHTVFLYKVPKMFLRCMDTNIPISERRKQRLMEGCGVMWPKFHC